MVTSSFAMAMLSSWAAVTAAKPCTRSQASSTNTTIQTIYQFPANTYVENLAVRANGQLLLDVFTSPQLWLVDPQLPGEAVLVHEFPDALGITGIAEYDDDVFAVLAGNFSFATGECTKGSWSIWSVDLGGVVINSAADLVASPPKISKLADVPAATCLNGIDLLSGGGAKKFLMAGDIRTGEIYAVDIDTGAAVVTIDNTVAQTLPAVTYGFGSVATDGLRVRDSDLYFSNVGRGLLVKIPLNPDDGTPAGEAQTVGQSLSSLDQWDDFAIDCDGNVFMATGGSNTVQRVTPDGHVAIVAGDLNSTAIAEPASARFGRRPDDSNVLYVTTAGGMVAPINGDTVVGAQVLVIRTNATSIC
ncbi:hypothetical protein DHEL01_v211461 [Diaporthe helianthi]|uniref:SMP-30/Gluconolactonase/LRE-like region domain-containing protein n=1 Tax=Diaporthe helianthi TaxID=158607 RepID=A0A2P5HIR9_DIAHE|nr:hypothetical protein DHEL01_v211461 [Diaporthe helianthi]